MALTRQQVRWASSHDWFVRSIPLGHTEDVDSGEACGWIAVCSENWTFTDKGTTTSHSREVCFADAKAMRDWAGY